MESRQRNSAIELLRIATIIMIIFHHFNVHGIWIASDYHLPDSWQLALSCMTGWGGNVGNEIFLIITGYFMIGREIHWKRIILLLCAMFLYSWVIAALFYGVLDAPFRWKDVVKYSFPLWSGVNWFVCCYLMFICFVPFINRFLSTLEKRSYQGLLLLNYGIFLFIPALHFHASVYLSGAWIQFFVMYMLGGYVRQYGMQSVLFQNKRPWKNIFCACILLMAVGTVFAVTGHWGSYWRIMNLIEPFMALSCFMIALLHKPFSSPVINSMAASVLGIYLIHDNPLVRKFIWTEWYPNLDMIGSDGFPLFMAGKVALVFLVCLGIDQLRLHFVEPYIKSRLDAHWDTWTERVQQWKKKVAVNYLDKV